MVAHLILFWASRCVIPSVLTPSMAEMMSPWARLPPAALLPGVIYGGVKRAGHTDTDSSEITQTTEEVTQTNITDWGIICSLFPQAGCEIKKIKCKLKLKHFVHLTADVTAQPTCDFLCVLTPLSYLCCMGRSSVNKPARSSLKGREKLMRQNKLIHQICRWRAGYKKTCVRLIDRVEPHFT